MPFFSINGVGSPMGHSDQREKKIEQAFKDANACKTPEPIRTPTNRLSGTSYQEIKKRSSMEFAPMSP